MVRKYKPRRAGVRWMEGAPEYVLSVHDNKGKTADRYTVYFGGSLAIEPMPDHPAYAATGPGNTWIGYLALSSNPDDPQGVSLWGEIPAYERSSRQRIRWLDLPENVRKHVIARATEED